MSLSSDLVSEFVKITNDSRSQEKEIVVYGTVVNDGSRDYVRIDGSSELTPIASTVEVNPSDRVIVNVKNHTATVTGNLTDPSIGVKRVGNIQSSITQTAEQIRLEVADLEKDLTASITVSVGQIRSEVKDVKSSLSSSITQTAAEIRSEVSSINSSLTSKISQTSSEIASVVSSQTAFSKFQQTVEGFSFMGKGGTVKISGGDITLTGRISWSDFDAGSQNRINAATELADTANLNAIKGLVTVGGFTITEGQQTYIDGRMIYSDSIYSNSIHLGGQMTVYQSLTGNSVGGYIGYCTGFNSQAGIGVMHSPYGSQCVCTNLAARLSYGGQSSFVAQASAAVVSGSGSVVFTVGGYDCVTVYSGSMIPTANLGASLGTAGKRWTDVYIGNSAINGSDRNMKHDIEDLPDTYVQIFDLIQPKRYKWNDGTSGRYHTGYIAQDFEDALMKLGMDSTEFGAFVKDKDEDGNDIYMLRYEELGAIYAAKIKQLEARIAWLESR